MGFIETERISSPVPRMCAHERARGGSPPPSELLSSEASTQRQASGEQEGAGPDFAQAHWVTLGGL
jgi:hypothetical protein